MLLNQSARTGSLSTLMAATTIANGAILVDDFDRIIFDDFSRDYPSWDWIRKIPAVGDFTNGFAKTGQGTARSADKRSLSYSATSPTRVARTPQEIKAIVRDIEFGLYDRSVYAQQGKRFGELTADDVRDVYGSMYELWSSLFWDGDVGGNALQFDGIKTMLGPATACLAAKSVVKFIQELVVTMMNANPDKTIRPDSILTNARIRQIISQEYRKVGDRMPEMAGSRLEMVGAVDTAAGYLPILVDPRASVIAATPMKYPLLLATKRHIAWNYIEPLAQAGPDAKLFEFAMTNTTQEQFKGVMFGAIDILGGSDHHTYCTIEDRTGAVDMTA